jgi:negative regulator of sigma E activity
MNVLDTLEGAADTVAEAALATSALLEEAATVSKEARHWARGLVKLLVVAIVIGAVVAAVKKMRSQESSPQSHS